MARARFDHVAILVGDLDRAIDDFRKILSVLDPKQISEIVLDEDVVDGAKVRWATFVKGDGGAALQLIESQIPRDQNLLDKRGECVHHISFCSTNVDETSNELLRSGVPVLYKNPPHSPARPWLRWNFIGPTEAHGVLIEISQEYKVEGGKWVDPSDH